MKGVSRYPSSGVGAPMVFSVPGSTEASTTDPMLIRRAIVGGEAARSWVSYVRGGVRRVIVISQGGSRCDPRTYVPALAGVATAMVAYATLGSGYQSPTQVAASIAATAVTLGDPATAGVGTVRVNGASGFLTGDAPALGAAGVHGRWGSFREYYDAGQLSFVGNGTACRYIVMPNFAGRITAIGIHGNLGYQPTLAVGRGNPFPAPGLITDIRSGTLAAPLSNAQPGIVTLLDPLSFSPLEGLWLMDRSDATGERSFRNHGSVPTGRFNQILNQANIFDATVTAPTPFGTTYTPTASFNFAIYDTIFVVFETAPYRGNGIIQPSWIGAVPSSATAGPPSVLATLPSLGVGGDLFKLRVPALRNLQLTRHRIAMAVVDANENAPCAVYAQGDSNVPTLAPGPLLGQVNMTALVANNFREATWTTPVNISSDNLGANPWVCSGFLLAQIAPPGGANISQLYYYPAGGDGNWLAAWPEGVDPEVYNDYVTSAAANTQNVWFFATSPMPANTPAPVWPGTYIPTGTDAQFGNMAVQSDLMESSQTGFTLLP